MNNMLALVDSEKQTRFEDLFENLFYKSVKSYKLASSHSAPVENQENNTQEDAQEDTSLGKREQSYRKYICDLAERKQKFGVDNISLRIPKAVIIKNHFNSVICGCDECMDNYRKLDPQEKFIFDTGAEEDDGKQQAALKKAEEDLKNLDGQNKVPESF